MSDAGGSPGLSDSTMVLTPGAPKRLRSWLRSRSPTRWLGWSWLLRPLRQRPDPIIQVKTEEALLGLLVIASVWPAQDQG